MKLFLLAFSPVLSGFLVKKLMTMLGLQNMLSLTGALMSGVAGAAKMGGDDKFGDKMHDSMKSGLTKHGNKLGSKLGKGDLGSALAEGNVTKATKFLGKSAANPYKAGQKAMKHSSDIKGKLKADAKNVKDNNKLLNKSKTAILKIKEKNKNIDDGVAVGIANGNPNAMFAGQLKVNAKSLTDRNIANSTLTGKDGIDKSKKILSKTVTGAKVSEITSSHEKRLNSLKAQQDSAETYNEKQKLAFDHQDMMVSKMIESGGISDMSELDVLDTQKGVSEMYGISKDNIVVPSNGLPPLVGLSTSDKGFVALGSDFDKNKELLSNPMHYLSDKDKKRLQGESDDAYSARIHLALESAGMFNPETNEYVNCVEKFNINDSDIALAMGGNTAILENYKIDISAKARAQAVKYSTNYDAQKAKQQALMVEATRGFLESQVNSAISTLNQQITSTPLMIEVPALLSNINESNFDGMSSAEKESFQKDTNKKIAEMLEKSVAELTQKKLAECNALSYIAGDKFVNAKDSERENLSKLAESLQVEALEFQNTQMAELTQMLDGISTENIKESTELVLKSIERTMASKVNDLNQSNQLARKQFDSYIATQKSNLSYTTKIESTKGSKKMDSAAKRHKVLSAPAGLLNG